MHGAYVAVGRRSRRAVDRLTSGLDRAGFEPFRGCATTHDAPESGVGDSSGSSDDGAYTARFKSGAIQSGSYSHPGRAEIFAPPVYPGRRNPLTF